MTTGTSELIEYDKAIRNRYKQASQYMLRATIRWADYNYWVLDKQIMTDETFDLLVEEYKKKYSEDTHFLDQIGMW